MIIEKSDMDAIPLKCLKSEDSYESVRASAFIMFDGSFSFGVSHTEGNETTMLHPETKKGAMEIIDAIERACPRLKVAR